MSGGCYGGSGGDPTYILLTEENGDLKEVFYVIIRLGKVTILNEKTNGLYDIIFEGYNRV